MSNVDQKQVVLPVVMHQVSTVFPKGYTDLDVASHADRLWHYCATEGLWSVTWKTEVLALRRTKRTTYRHRLPVRWPYSHLITEYQASSRANAFRDPHTGRWEQAREGLSRVEFFERGDRRGSGDAAPGGGSDQGRAAS